MQLLKKREGSYWRLYMNQERTSLYIEKSTERKQWGAIQEYDLCHDTYGFLIAGTLQAIMATTEHIMQASTQSVTSQILPQPTE